MTDLHLGGTGTNLHASAACDWSPAEFSNVHIVHDDDKRAFFATVSDDGIYPGADELLEIAQNHCRDYLIDETSVRKAAARQEYGVQFAVAFAKDAEVEVSIAENERKAFVLIRPPHGGRDLSMDDVLEVLRARGVAFGVDAQAIESALCSGQYNGRVLCALAAEAVPGTDAEIYVNFKTEFATEPKEIDHDKVDFRELGCFATVSKGSVVARKRPATPGREGVTVTGRNIPAKPGKDAALVAGRGTHLSYDGTQIISDIDGHPLVSGKTFSVEPVWEVPGDVDFSKGNIHFAGSVHIIGNVISGFAVTATENIEIDGFVEGSTIKAGGDVLIKGGVQGRGSAYVSAGRTAAMLFVEHARVEAGKDIVAGEVLHADLSAKERIVLNIGKGQACGGSLRAGNGLVAKVLGSEVGVQTRISVGYEPDAKRRCDAFKEEKANLEEYLQKTEYGITALLECMRDGASTPRRQEMYARLLSTREHLQSELAEIESELTEAVCEVTESAAADITVTGTLFPNTTLAIRGTALVISDPWHHVTFCEQEGEVKAVPLV